MGGTERLVIQRIWSKTAAWLRVEIAEQEEKGGLRRRHRRNLCILLQAERMCPIALEREYFLLFCFSAIKIFCLSKESFQWHLRDPEDDFLGIR